jgi:hypothetical protein
MAEYIDKEAVCEDAKKWFQTSNMKLYNDCVQMVRDRVTALPAADVRENGPILTKADEIRAMSDEELAKWLARIEWKVLEKQPAITEYAMRMDWLDWLKSPVEVDKCR